MLVEGVKLIKKISEIVKWITNLHANEGRPMVKSVLLEVCKLIEVLKLIQLIYQQNLIPLTYIVFLNLQFLTHKVHQLLSKIKVKFMTYKV